MKLQVMVVYDSKARAFLQPWFSSHIDVGKRSFAQAANQGGHQICENAADFVLWHLGTFDDDNAVFDMLRPASNLGPASQFKKGTALVQHEKS